MTRKWSAMSHNVILLFLGLQLALPVTGQSVIHTEPTYCGPQNLTEGDFPFTLPTPCFGDYCVNTRCTWSICLPGSVFRVSFVALDIESGPLCSYDFLRIAGGAKICGNHQSDFTVSPGSNGCVNAEFSSDFFMSLSGFTINMQGANGCPVNHCRNGGQCYIPTTSGLPACSCPQNSTGETCERPYSPLCEALWLNSTTEEFGVAPSCRDTMECYNARCQYTICTDTSFVLLERATYDIAQGVLFSICMEKIEVDGTEYCVDEFDEPMVIPATSAEGCAEVLLTTAANSFDTVVRFVYTAMPETMCSEPRCMNGGTCHPSYQAYTCTCPPGYSGALCQISPETTTTATAAPAASQLQFLETSEGMAVVGTCCGLAVLLLLSLGYCCYHHTQRSNRVMPFQNDPYACDDDYGAHVPPTVTSVSGQDPWS